MLLKKLTFVLAAGAVILAGGLSARAVKAGAMYCPNEADRKNAWMASPVVPATTCRWSGA
ncbi:hypothetical protein [Neorhizobium sp. LjRoot104]|uniref:hypothetical protein n=1 Tax=Neorhizobium sp. LjRoot104 TaxID=3342254 RepID=UPI003ED0DFD0